MSNSKKIWLLIFTLTPILFLIGFIMTFFTGFFKMVHTEHLESSPNPEEVLFNFVGAPILMLIVSGMLSTGLLIYYIVHAAKSKKLDQGMKVFWIFAHLFFMNLSFLVYWLIEIWQDEEVFVNEDYLN